MKILILLFFSVLAFSLEPTPIDKTRPHLDKLREKSEVKYDDYEFPYLIMQTARISEGTAEKIKERLQKALRENLVLLDKNQHVDKSKLIMPKIFSEGDQAEALETCSKKKCNIKLSVEETKAIETTPSTLKASVYHQKIVDRVNTYLKTGEIKGYEERENNETAVIEMAKSLEFLKFKYPKVAAFIFNKGWKNRGGLKKAVNEFFLVNEIVRIAPERLQPIWRMGEILRFEENGAQLFFYLPIYTNHYFDASFTLYEIIPQKEKNILIVTDILEVDELKKSGFIRALFKGKMVDAVSLAEDVFLKKVTE